MGFKRITQLGQRSVFSTIYSQYLRISLSGYTLNLFIALRYYSGNNTLNASLCVLRRLFSGLSRIFASLSGCLGSSRLSRFRFRLVGIVLR